MRKKAFPARASERAFQRMLLVRMESFQAEGIKGSMGTTVGWDVW